MEAGSTGLVRSLVIAVALASVGFLLAATPAGAQAEEQPREIVLEAHDDLATNAYWFTLEGEDERNPSFTLEPGETVTFRLVNVGDVEHNFHIMPMDEATPLIGPGNEASVMVTAPEEEGEYEYWCDPHKELGMRGTYTVRAPDEAAPAGEEDDPEEVGAPDQETPVPAALVLFAGAAAALAFANWGRGRD